LSQIRSSATVEGPTRDATRYVSKFVLL